MLTLASSSVSGVRFLDLFILILPLLQRRPTTPHLPAAFTAGRARRLVQDRVDGETGHFVALDEGAAGTGIGLDGADEWFLVAVDDARAAELVLEIGRDRGRVRVRACRPGAHGPAGRLAGALEHGRAQVGRGAAGG
ncbi:hypothetical protein PG997_014866 [Apiospora hydei]|uniref:Uncharacterized protein n=1 Tax=Apiospora hydei TaxID=1337664 RepID=A0ABR1UV09_9PEZI